jgi:hypothetical protein
MTMKKIVLATALIASVLASAVSASANRYIDPNAPFDGQKFFNSIPSGQ